MATSDWIISFLSVYVIIVISKETLFINHVSQCIKLPQCGQKGSAHVEMTLSTVLRGDKKKKRLNLSAAELCPSH